jgi:RNA polymerase sigma factor (TIGR02999 family)
VAPGNDQAYDRLVPFVYAELRRLARGQLRREREGHSLQPTALVHEAYLRLVTADVDWQDRAHFLSVAARVMRRILVEHARARRARKRGGDDQRVILTVPIAAPDTDPIDVMVLDEAMERLQTLDARQAQIVEPCSFGGLTYLEVGQALGISEATGLQSIWPTLWHQRQITARAPAQTRHECEDFPLRVLRGGDLLEGTTHERRALGSSDPAHGGSKNPAYDGAHQGRRGPTPCETSRAFGVPDPPGPRLPGLSRDRTTRGRCRDRA